MLCFILWNSNAEMWHWKMHLLRVISSNASVLCDAEGITLFSQRESEMRVILGVRAARNIWIGCCCWTPFDHTSKFNRNSAVGTSQRLQQHLRGVFLLRIFTHVFPIVKKTVWVCVVCVFGYRCVFYAINWEAKKKSSAIFETEQEKKTDKRPLFRHNRMMY